MNPRPPPCQGEKQADENTLSEYLSIIQLKDISQRHLKEVNRYLTQYLDYVGYSFNKLKSIEYFSYLLKNYKTSTYRKEVYQILKFLRHQNIRWANEITLPREPNYQPIKIVLQDILDALQYFTASEYYPRFKAIIMLGATSGLRAEELYQLTIDDINIDERTVYINHNPTNGQSTKTKQSRVSFFNQETKEALSDYINYFNSNNNLKTLFPQRWLEGKFRNTNLRVKYLRKFFSQEWDRRGGPTSIKKILMGHSLRNDVDLMHYNAQSPEDLKKIYDKVMSGSILSTDE